MARVKATHRKIQGRPQPRFQVPNQSPSESDESDESDESEEHSDIEQQTEQQNNMSQKRKSTDDIDDSQPKTARTSAPIGGSAVGASRSTTTAAASTGSSMQSRQPTASLKKAPLPTTSAASTTTPTAVPAVPATGLVQNAPTHRYFMQIYLISETNGVSIPWNPHGEKEAWMHMHMDECLVKFDMETGINFCFSDDCFKVIPYGRTEPNIYDHNMCGFTLAHGYSMKWQYDNMFHYHVGNSKRAFMVVKLPISKPNPPPFTKSDSPAIDAAMRTRFKISYASNPTTPYWFPSSQVEREREYWKSLYQSKKNAYDKAVEDYNELDDKNILLQKKLDKSEVKAQLQTLALQKIDIALECAVCFERFSSAGPSVMANCGHVVHMECKKNLEEKQSANVCVECRAPISHWQDFPGFTAISEAITKLHTALDTPQ